MIRRTYNWFTEWAIKPQATSALFAFSLAEAIIFPIPPDPLLIAMVFNEYKKWVRYALITTVASIIGGIIGYGVGWGLFETFGQWILDTFHLQEGYIELGKAFSEGTFIAVLTAALTPIPFKLITLTAGAFQVNFFIFLISAVIGRSSRFFGVAYLAKYLGRSHKELIERYINLISIGLVLVIALVLWLL
jgi:membrane protein YqaA with SNARE-associated domain